jgi:hypothetical protein
MNTADNIRLAALGLILLALQMAWYVWFPGLRGGFDLFVPLLLLLTALRGPEMGGTFALIGGVVMDSYSLSLPAFHVLYYLLPVIAGTLLRSRLLTGYRQLGVAAIAVILLLKILLPWLIGVLSGALPSALYLFQVSYLPPLLICGLLYLCWSQAVRLVTPPLETLRSA